MVCTSSYLRARRTNKIVELVANKIFDIYIALRGSLFRAGDGLGLFCKESLHPGSNVLCALDPVRTHSATVNATRQLTGQFYV